MSLIALTFSESVEISFPDAWYLPFLRKIFLLLGTCNVGTLLTDLNVLGLRQFQVYRFV